MLRNMNISKKLMITLIVNITTVIMITLLGWIGFGQLSANSTYIADRNVQAVHKLSEIRNNTIQMRLITQRMLDEEYKHEIVKDEKEINELLELDDSLIKEYEEIEFSSQAEKISYEEGFKNKLQDFRKSRNEVINMIKNGEYEKARKYYKESYNNNAIAVEQSLTDSITENVKSAYLKNTQNKDMYKGNSRSLVLLSVLGSLISLSISFAIIKAVNSKIKKVLSFTKSLGEGDFTQEIKVTNNDELDNMSRELNKASANMKTLINDIILGMEELNSSSEELTATMEEVTANIEVVKVSTQEIVEGNVALSSSTQEVSASAEELEALAGEVMDKAINSEYKADEIMNVATTVKSKSKEATEIAIEIYNEAETRVKQSIEDAKVVNEISIMADTIGNIAKQTNLLSLNASIEAARAGESGRGFSVVADEVRKLAEQSAQTVIDIRSLITKVQNSIGGLVENSSGLLSFIEHTVKPDYTLMADIGRQYQGDAEFVFNTSKDIAVSTQTMIDSISEVNASIQNVSATTEQTASSSEEILSNLNQTVSSMEEVSKQAQANAELAEKISRLTQKFKI